MLSANLSSCTEIYEGTVYVNILLKICTADSPFEGSVSIIDLQENVLSIDQQMNKSVARYEMLCVCFVRTDCKVSETQSQGTRAKSLQISTHPHTRLQGCTVVPKSVVALVLCLFSLQDVQINLL